MKTKQNKQNKITKELILNILKPKLNSCLLSLYIAFVFFEALFINNKLPNLFIGSIITIFLLVISYIITSFLLHKVEKIRITKQPQKDKFKILSVFLLASLISFLVFLVVDVAYFPGSMCWDVIDHTTDVLTGNYNNWHPLSFVLFMFTLPLKVFKVIESTTIISFSYLSLAIGYMCSIMYKYSGKKPVIISLLFLLTNPTLLIFAITPIKDVLFSVLCMISMTMIFDAYFSDKNRKLWYVLILGLILGCLTIVRHNGILFSLPLLIISIILFKDKIKRIGIVATLCLVLVSNVILLKSMHIQPSVYRVVELSGMPITVVLNAAIETPEKVSYDIQDVVYSTYTKDFLKKYQCGNFNSIKWLDYSKRENLERIGVPRWFWLMFKATIQSPKESLRAFFSLTDIVYGVDNVGLKTGIDYWVDERYGIAQYRGNEMLKNIMRIYQYNFISFTGLKYFYTFGVLLIVLNTFWFSRLKKGKTQQETKENLMRFSFMIPMVIYNSVTMMLLAGKDLRFFFYTDYIAPLLILFIVLDTNKNKNA